MPAVDTLLLLRPTDSPTLFLQQLGRGLRRSPARPSAPCSTSSATTATEFRFDRRFRALARRQPQGARRSRSRAASRSCRRAATWSSTRSRPRSCCATSARPSRRAGPRRSRSCAARRATEATVSPRGFLEETGLELEDVYTGGKIWSDLVRDAGLPVRPAGPQEDVLRRACGRLLHVDDLRAHRGLPSVPGARRRRRVRDALEPSSARLLRMLVASVVGPGRRARRRRLQDGCALLWAAPAGARASSLELLGRPARRGSSTSTDRSRSHPDVPLQVHARYTRIEILAAFGIGEGAKVAPWQTGVYWAKEARADLLAFTLDKTSGAVLPDDALPRLRDQPRPDPLGEPVGRPAPTARPAGATSTTSRCGTSVMLFARLRSDDRAFWFLGPATYVRHESELPMAVTWRLQHPLPAICSRRSPPRWRSRRVTSAIVGARANMRGRVSSWRAGGLLLRTRASLGE